MRVAVPAFRHLQVAAEHARQRLGAGISDEHLADLAREGGGLANAALVAFLDRHAHALFNAAAGSVSGKYLLSLDSGQGDDLWQQTAIETMGLLRSWRPSARGPGTAPKTWVCRGLASVRSGIRDAAESEARARLLPQRSHRTGERRTAPSAPWMEPAGPLLPEFSREWVEDLRAVEADRTMPPPERELAGHIADECEGVKGAVGQGERDLYYAHGRHRVNEARLRVRDAVHARRGPDPVQPTRD